MLEENDLTCYYLLQEKIGYHYTIYVYDINSLESLDLIKRLNPKIIVSIASPQILRMEVIDSVKYAINIHAALLPEYRGMMPSFWVLARGEKKTGVTVHRINERIDGGAIILQKTIDISPQDTLHSLQTKVANVGAIALLDALKKYREHH